MQTQPDIDKAQNTQAIDTLIHLGAGRCSELDDYLALQPRYLLLVEADPLLAEDLNARTEGLTQVQVMRAAVAGQPGSATFYRYNLPDANGLHPASGLLELFPGLKTVEQLQVEAVGPEVLMQPIGLQSEQKNRLVIDLPGEELPVLQALEAANILHLFRQVHLHCGHNSLCEGGEPAARVLQWLKRKGFNLVTEDHSRDPDRPRWSLERDTQQLRNRDLQRQVEALQAQLKQSTRKNKALENQVVELQAHIQQLTQACDDQKKIAAEHQARIEQLTKARDEQVKLAADRQSLVQQLIKTQEEQKKLNKTQRTELNKQSALLQNEEMAAQIEKHQNDLISVRKYLESTIKKEVLNATKQLESYLSILHYMQSDELIGDMHNWPISPDFALFLIRQLEINDYDLVIEFGSGTSTVIMAKTLAKIAIQRRGKTPVRQVAFEHLGKYHAQTHTNLQQAGLAEDMLLVYAPLAPYTAPNGNTYSYYDCHQTMEELAQELTPDDLRILVVVDGPPTSTGKHARYPAVPMILAHFIGAQIDILLDDYIRDEEKEIVQLWLADIQTKRLQSMMIEKKMEKDACLITILP